MTTRYTFHGNRHRSDGFVTDCIISINCNGNSIVSITSETFDEVLAAIVAKHADMLTAITYEFKPDHDGDDSIFFTYVIKDEWWDIARRPPTGDDPFGQYSLLDPLRRVQWDVGLQALRFYPELHKYDNVQLVSDVAKHAEGKK